MFLGDIKQNEIKLVTIRDQYVGPPARDKKSGRRGKNRVLQNRKILKLGPRRGPPEDGPAFGGLKFKGSEMQIFRS